MDRAPAGSAACGPVFLAGADRSGIGLLGELLERHPDLAMTRRTDFWHRFAGRFGDLRSAENVERCLAALAGDRRTRVLEPDRDVLRADLALAPTYDQLFASLQRQRADRLGRSRWGDKSLGAERHAERILHSYPDARVVHVLRDPRDRYASYADHREGGRGGVAAGAAVWAQSVRLAEHHRRRHPHRYRILRYEDLVSAPDRVLPAVCAFLGLRWVESALDGSAADGRPGPLHTHSIGRYRGELSATDIALLQLTNRRRMCRFGYEPDAVRFGPRDAARFAVAAAPGHLAREVLWAPLAGVRDQFGDVPPRT